MQAHNYISREWQQHSFPRELGRDQGERRQDCSQGDEKIGPGKNFVKIRETEVGQRGDRKTGTPPSH